MEADSLSTYLDHLPAIFRQEPFLGRFLLAFERILSGLDPTAQETPLGLEQILDRIHTFFDPVGDGTANDSLRAPDDFLPWLASWVATSLRDDWEPDVRRRFIQNMASLYRIRGTPEGLKEMLKLYLGPDQDIQVIDGAQLSETSQAPHYFQVSFTVSVPDPALLSRMDRIARAIIDQEKPAHTYYGLAIKFPTMQINNDPQKGLHIGKNTVLGARTFTGDT